MSDISNSDESEELQTLRDLIYAGENNLISRFAEIEAKMSAVDERSISNTKLLESVIAKYEPIVAEEKKGRWGLTLLLVSTLVGWIAQYIRTLSK